MPDLKQALTTTDAADLLAQLEAHGKIHLELAGDAVELDEEDIQVRLRAKAGWTAAQGKGCVVVLSTELTDELLREGVARDLVRLIQHRRKALDCEYTDRIVVAVVTESKELKQALSENANYIKGETLAIQILAEPLEHVEGIDLRIADHKLVLYVLVVQET